jgi:hypothetical protein
VRGIECEVNVKWKKKIFNMMGILSHFYAYEERGVALSIEKY